MQKWYLRWEKCPVSEVMGSNVTETSTIFDRDRVNKLCTGRNIPYLFKHAQVTQRTLNSVRDHPHTHTHTQTDLWR